MEQLPIHWRLLCLYIEDALRQQSSRAIALVLARKLDAGDYRIVSTFALNRHDRLDPATLEARVDVRCHDGWAELCSVHWTHLGLEWSDVMAEVDNVYWQYAAGTYPGGPLDPDRESV